MSLEQDDRKEIEARFKIVCRKCGGENCTVDFQRGEVYSEDTRDSDILSMGCPDCKNNDLFIRPDW